VHEPVPPRLPNAANDMSDPNVPPSSPSSPVPVPAHMPVPGSDGIDSRPGDADAQARVDAARAVLIRLMQDLVAAEVRVDDLRVADLLEANQQLVVAALREQQKAEAATQALQVEGRRLQAEADAAEAALRRQQDLREANERLVLAAVDAQALRDAAERARQRQADFMAVVAQELQNPLAPIRLASAMLGRTDTDVQLLPRAQAIIDQQVQHMARLVAAVQDVSRANAATLGADAVPVDFNALITAAVGACAPAVQARQQHLRVELPTEVAWVRGDPPRLAQIVANLLDNATQYSHTHGEIVVVAKVGDGVVTLTVSDNGIGITPLAMPTIFEPFVQDSQAIGFNGVGVGIGLTVARALVEAHRGRIRADSKGSGRGSRFTVVLPLTPPRSTGGQP
jgi:signal transduction histidine kinase